MAQLPLAMHESNEQKKADTSPVTQTTIIKEIQRKARSIERACSESRK